MHYNITLTLLILTTASALCDSIVADLRRDYSTTANPNGAWSYNGGGSPLGYTAAWNGFGPSWTAGGADLAWTKATYSSHTFQSDWSVGDIVVHGSDGNSTGGQIRPANATWTSTFNGIVNIAGSTWLAFDNHDRGSVWSISLNDRVLSMGTITSFASYGESSPFYFRDGSGGAGALQNIVLHTGDVLKLQFDKTSRWGAMNVANFTVYDAVPEGSRSGILFATGFLCLLSLKNKYIVRS